MRQFWGVVLAGLVLATGGCGGGEGGKRAVAGPSPSAYAVPEDLAIVLGSKAPITGATKLPATAALGGPNFTVQLTEAGAVRQLPADLVEPLAQLPIGKGASGPLDAGEGREFLLVGLADIPALGASYNRTIVGPPTTARLTVGGQDRQLAGYATPRGTLVALVPAGAPVRLVFSDSGRDQSIDLRTGQPGPDAVAAYTVAPPDAEKEYKIRARLSGEPFDDELDVELSAIMWPFDFRAQHGWAAPGRAWLLVTVETGLSSLRLLDGALDLAGSVQLKAGGSALATGAGTCDIERTNIGLEYKTTCMAEINVPATLSTLTVTFAPKGSFTRDGQPASYRFVSNPQQTLKLQ